MLLITAGLLPGCSRQQAQTPEEEFIEAYRTAYEGGDETSLWKLVNKRDEIPEEVLPIYRAAFGTFPFRSLGKHKVKQITLDPYVHDPAKMKYGERPIAFNLTPIYVLNVESSGNEGFEWGGSTFKMQLPVGRIGNACFFCGAVWDE